MPEGWALVLALPLGYLLGSLPFGYGVARWRGVDIFRVGTGNPGAANVARQVGPWWGVLVFLGDAGKGAVAVGVGRALGLGEGLEVIPGASALVGHWFPLFLRFRGGAGLAPVIGVALVVAPWQALGSIGLGMVVLAFTRNTGLSAGVVAPVFLLWSALAGLPPWTLVGVALLLILVLLRGRYPHLFRRG